MRVEKDVQKCTECGSRNTEQDPDGTTWCHDCGVYSTPGHVENRRLARRKIDGIFRGEAALFDICSGAGSEPIPFRRRQQYEGS